MDITTPASVEACLIYFDLASMSGLLKHEPMTKKRGSRFQPIPAHSKFVKRGIANTRKGPSGNVCLHTIKRSHCHPVGRLKSRSYTHAIVRSVTERLFKEKDMLGVKSSNTENRPVAIPYSHEVGQYLVNWSKKFGTSKFR